MEGMNKIGHIGQPRKVPGIKLPEIEGVLNLMGSIRVSPTNVPTILR
jgi:hypothetical protein